MQQVFRTIASILVAAMCALPAAYAATGSSAEMTSNNGFSLKFVSGGSTPESRKNMEKMASDYDLLLGFKGPKKDQDYTNLNVDMVNKSGLSVLNAKAGGPLFYIQIPPGDYTVTANLDGNKMIKSVHVAPNQTSRLTFDWRT